MGLFSKIKKAVRSTLPGGKAHSSLTKALRKVDPLGRKLGAHKIAGKIESRVGRDIDRVQRMGDRAEGALGKFAGKDPLLRAGLKNDPLGRAVLGRVAEGGGPGAGLAQGVMGRPAGGPPPIMPETGGGLPPTPMGPPPGMPPMGPPPMGPPPGPPPMGPIGTGGGLPPTPMGPPPGMPPGGPGGIMPPGMGSPIPQPGMFPRRRPGMPPL